MRVKDLMEASPAAVYLDDPISAAADLMVESRVGAVPVVDSAGRLVGVVRDLDVLHLLLPDYLESLADLGFLPPDLEPGACGIAEACGLPVRQAVADQAPASAEEDEPLLEAVRTMIEGGLDTLPVVRDGVLVGVLTARRVLRDMAGPGDEAGTT